MSNLQFKIICLLLPVILIACSSSLHEPFEDLIEKHKNADKITRVANSGGKKKKRIVNFNFSYDTLFIKVHKSENDQVYYMAALMIHKGIRVYAVLLIWEIDPLLYIFAKDRPYGKCSWKYVAWLTNSELYRSVLYLRPLKGEEFRKAKSKIFERNYQKEPKKPKIHKRRR